MATHTVLLGSTHGSFPKRSHRCWGCISVPKPAAKDQQVELGVINWVGTVVSFWCAATHLPRVYPPRPGRDRRNWLRAKVQTEWVADDSRSRLCTGCLSRFGQLLRDRIAERSRRSIGDEVATGDPQCLAIRQWSSRGSISAECGRAACEPGRVWNAQIDRSRLPRTGEASCQRTRVTVVLGWRDRAGQSHVQRLLLT